MARPHTVDHGFARSFTKLGALASPDIQPSVRRPSVASPAVGSFQKNFKAAREGRGYSASCVYGTQPKNTPLDILQPPSIVSPVKRSLEPATRSLKPRKSCSSGLGGHSCEFASPALWAGICMNEK